MSILRNLCSLRAAFFLLMAGLVVLPSAVAQDEADAPQADATPTADAPANEAQEDTAEPDAQQPTGSPEPEARTMPAGVEGAASEDEPDDVVSKINNALKPADEFFGTVNEAVGSVIFFPTPVGPKAGDKQGETKTEDARVVEARAAYAEFKRKEAAKKPPEPEKEPGLLARISSDYTTMPLAVIVLLAGATFFTIKMSFINLRGFWHAIMVTAGKYDNPEDEGEVTHFQALTAALSATVGLGNIAGVAVAIALGGAGATFWMIVAGFIGMTSKFVECTLGQMYRETRPDGRVMGGAMYYLSKGLGEMGFGPMGKVLGAIFAILCVGGSFAGGNSYQVNQSLGAISVAVDSDTGSWGWIYGLVMAAMVAVVIIGGIKRIAGAAEKIVPAMCGIYVVAAMAILLMNIDAIPAAINAVFAGAFSMEAGIGGFVGVLVVGFQRAAFSNEAGVGSAAIAHAAAKTDYPAREGLVALLGPFIDTVVICTMTALVLIVTDPVGDLGVREQGALVAAANAEGADVEAAQAKINDYVKFQGDQTGAGMTALAMDSQIPFFKYILAVCCILFAFSTMISWSYYGERCWAYLFGDNASMAYRCIFVVFTFLGSIVSAKNVFDFGDLMIFGMAVPNVIGVVMLSGKVRAQMDDYWAKLKSGEIQRTK